MGASGIVREPMAIGRGVAAGALADCCAAQSEPEDVGGWLNSLSPKAFKGKGVLWKLRQATEERDRIEFLMRELQSISRTVPGREIVLAILRYPKERLLTRWKVAHGVSRCLRFEDAQEKYWGRYAEPLRGWYATVSQQAELLNLRHRKLMAKIHELRAQLPTMPVFPRGSANGIQLHALAKERLADFVAMASAA